MLNTDQDIKLVILFLVDGDDLTCEFRNDIIFVSTLTCNLKSSKLGDFTLDKLGDDVFYLQNGIYRFNGKWKQRGFGNLQGNEIEHLDTVERNGRLYYKLSVLRSARLRSSIIQNALADIGRIQNITREINLNADRKRFWFGKIESIDVQNCNESLPLSLNYFPKDAI